MFLERVVYVLSILIVGVAFFLFSSKLQPTQAQLSANANSKSNANPGAIQDKKIVFSDEFDGSTLDLNKWGTCYDWREPTEGGCTNHGNFEEQWYTDEQSRIENGELVLTAKPKLMDVAVQNTVKRFPYTSGMINSGRGSTAGSVRWAGTYGYYEAKIKTQSGQGVWPAFWLLPIDRKWPPEIDIMEYVGGKPGEILQTYHWEENGSPVKNETIIRNVTDYSSEWHTYAVDWREDGIDWYIDGQKTKSYTGANVPHEPMEIILNLAIGGSLPGPADKNTPFPRELRVDYVRVYQAGKDARPHSY